ncbi:MAG: hypothetical protein A2X25_12405 [Chloroflexi bacterium GWB2_49_20]|nr:MAG: hypothetical protein A2X25_12405 [Chloroflexi bacterium GWB2_49_20]OGN78476.1 MAG: hypothetical protein A2X26_01795 [Chloroflexi bacterium GWC2_49_37]OGN84061.1 MAG: hypothetical protein A2X27_13890 [Chloroflexi bacterium GWD2_49_16]HBG75295.1 hypothetical protein [Anaerolineae bacterium]HCC79071.1 hypothetical protein [Anaerolineae bacterium]
MQTCEKCNATSHDTAIECPNCKTTLAVSSQTASALKRFRNNPHVTAIRISGHSDACPACQAVLQTYSKEEAPVLPIPGCSHTHGCRCFYEPVSPVAALIGRVTQ